MVVCRISRTRDLTGGTHVKIGELQAWFEFPTLLMFFLFPVFSLPRFPVLALDGVRDSMGSTNELT